MDSSSFSTEASSPRLEPLDTMKRLENDEIESGYASASSSSSTTDSTPEVPQITLTKAHLRHLNQQMARLSAEERLRLSLRLFPGLYQTTAFGLTGLVTLDMLSRLAAEDATLPAVEAVFLDTLHHFAETHELVARVRARYSGVRVHTYRPAGAATAGEFEARYGAALYEVAPELYDWVAKVEPQQRAYAELGVAAVLTGRRRSQGGARDNLPFVEVDDGGVVKVNPLLDWSFARVRAYVADHDVPYNALLDRGYTSVGDWHSTVPVAAGEDERAGRWKGQAKTECGIHNKKSRYAQFLLQQQQQQEQPQKVGEEERVEKLDEQQQQQLTSALEQVERERMEAEEEIQQRRELIQDFATGRWIPVVC